MGASFSILDDIIGREKTKPKNRPSKDESRSFMFFKNYLLVSIPLIYMIILMSCSEVHYRATDSSKTSQVGGSEDAMVGIPVRIEARKDGSIISGTIYFAEDISGFDLAGVTLNDAKFIAFNGGPRNFVFKIQANSTGTTRIFVPAGVAQNPNSLRFNMMSNIVEFDFAPTVVAADYKTFSFTVDEIGKVAPVDLVLIVDDSHSMEPYQERLGIAMRDAVAQLKGRDLRVFLYSTTQVGLNTVHRQSNFFNNGVAVHHNYTGSYATAVNQKTRGLYFGGYINNIGTYQNQSKAPALSRRTFFVKKGVASAFNPLEFFDHDEIHEVFGIGPSAFDTKEGVLTFDKAMEDKVYQDQLNKLRDQIRLGSKGASNGELPLCTLAHYLMADGPYADGNNTRKKAFVLLSDEDQSNLACLKGFFSRQQRPAWVRMYPNVYYYETRVDLDMRGDQGSQSYVKRVIQLDRKADCIEGSTNRCTEKGKLVDCTASETEAAYTRIQQIHVSRFGDGTYRIPATKKCQIHVRHIDRNFPAQFNPGILVKNGTKCDDSSFIRQGADGSEVQVNESLRNYFIKTYPQFDFLPEACNLDPFSHIQSDARFLHLDLSAYEQSVSKLIRSKADQRFGRSNYLFATIGNLGDGNPSNCEALPHERSTSLLELADKDHTLSICHSAYTPLVSWINRFVLYSPRKEYSLPITGDNILAVRFKGNTQQFLPDQYDIKDGMIHFKTDSLKKGDEVEVLWR
jgi:hypothetical protein